MGIRQVPISVWCLANSIQRANQCKKYAICMTKEKFDKSQPHTGFVTSWAVRYWYYHSVYSMNISKRKFCTILSTTLKFFVNLEWIFHNMHDYTNYAKTKTNTKSWKLPYTRRDHVLEPVFSYCGFRLHHTFLTLRYSIISIVLCILFLTYCDRPPISFHSEWLHCLFQIPLEIDHSDKSKQKLKHSKMKRRVNVGINLYLTSFDLIAESFGSFINWANTSLNNASRGGRILKNMILVKINFPSHQWLQVHSRW